MAVEMRKVFSSVVDEIGYDPDTGDLYVTWIKSGKTSVYSGVPDHVARQVSNAPSVGSALNDMVKPFHSHRYA